MKQQDFILVRYDADENMVFDWKEPRYFEDVNKDTGEVVQIQEHLYAKTLFIGANDTIDNYVEVEAPVVGE